MKKSIYIFIIASLAFAFKNAPKILTVGMVASVIEHKGQNFTNFSDFSNHTYVVYETNSPGNTHGNRFELLKISHDTLIWRGKNLFIDSAASMNSGNPTGKLLWLNGTKLMATSIASVNLPYSQISGTPTIPTNNNQLTNGSGFLTTESDPLFDSKFSAKTTSGLSEGSNLYYTSARTHTDISAGTGISYNNSTGVITNSIPDQTVSIYGTLGFSVTSSYPSFTLIPYSSTTFTASRAINSATFQVSLTKQACVFYTIRINCVATIGAASAGTVALQYSSNGGSTWIDIGQVENSNTVTLAIVLNSNTTQTSQISGIIPAGAIVRMNQTTSGTTTITYVRGNETY